ncbi:MAG: UDP-N-acetylmuramoyl-L-alanyl-D-glutamate--2,6-diaminopimelate ligase [bacterium]|nr:UDP-N-acetylmuramoyl-L-alanyl-D-glutamate--2,6-diaminopimelate ligase [bacterium]
MLRPLKNIYHLFVAALAAFFYRFPAKKLKVIGVTGTDGKTTTAHLIYHLLKSAGKKVSMVSTIGAAIGDKECDTGFHVTTPDPREMQGYLRRAVNSGSEYMVLEVTSHALDQNRVAFCNFLIGVLTNVSHEHLDYHRTYENYAAAKMKLLKMAKVAVVNRDDESFKYVNGMWHMANGKLVTYGIRNKADFTPQKINFKINLPGEFNKYNALAAVVVALNLRISEEEICNALLTFKLPEGRMEIVYKDSFSVIIDFAHTPNALTQILSAVRALQPKKLITVFGCAGERDFKKRPFMGEVAAKMADYTVLTAEDPRREDVNKIIDQITQGCLKVGAQERKDFFRIPDRQEAINFAIRKLAQPGDLVVIAGKGHEKSMRVGNKEYPWSDREAVKKALEGRK